MKLHKLVSLALFVAFGSFAAGQSFIAPDITVASNTLVVIAGPTDAKWAPAWSTNLAYAQGSVVKTPAGQVFFASVAGTSTNVSTGYPQGVGLSVDGTVTWRPCSPRARSWLSVQDTGTNTACSLYILSSIGGGTNFAQAVTLQSGGSVVMDNGKVPQGSIYAIATRNTTVVIEEL